MTITWNKLASNILKSELKRKGITYEQLNEKLAAIGINETVHAVRIKVNRGTFQFAFFLQCAAAIGLKSLRLEELITDESE